MEPVTNKIAWPAFLRVVPDIQRVKPYTRYLLHPLVDGELVKVAPWDEQGDEQFRRRYVRVIRKDASGQWSLRYVLDWTTFEPLKKKTPYGNNG